MPLILMAMQSKTATAIVLENTFTPTSTYRWLIKSNGEKVLQRAWQNCYNGGMEWREIETVRDAD